MLMAAHAKRDSMALLMGLCMVAYLLFVPNPARADYVPQEMADQNSYVAAVGDPQYLVGQASGQTQSADDAMSNALSVFKTVQTSTVTDLVNSYDQYYYGTVARSINYATGLPSESTLDPSVLQWSIQKGFTTDYTAANAANQGYSYWQKEGYYNTFTPTQQNALQSLQPILAANDNTAYYRYDPTTGVVQIQASGLIGQVRLVHALDKLGISNKEYLHLLDHPNDYSPSSWASMSQGIFGTKYGIFLQTIPVPPGSAQQNTSGNNGQQSSGGPPTRSSSVSLSG